MSTTNSDSDSECSSPVIKLNSNQYDADSALKILKHIKNEVNELKHEILYYNSSIID